MNVVAEFVKPGWMIRIIVMSDPVMVISAQKINWSIILTVISDEGSLKRIAIPSAHHVIRVC
jgi:hypothetical protein